MAGNLLSELESLKAKIQETGARIRALEERNRTLMLENEDLRRQTREALSERDRVRQDCEYLEVSHKLADNPDTLVATRRRLAGLIRNIDLCLEMLKE